MSSIIGPKVLLVPPDVYDKAKADGARTYEQDAPMTNDTRVPLMRDNFGVCKPGEGFEIRQELFEPLRMAPLPLLAPDPEPRFATHRFLAYSMATFAVPSPPPFLGIDIGKDEPMVFVDEFQWFDRGAYYRVTNQINGRKRQERQRLDRWSNVRRAKRALELDRRRKDAP